MYYMRICFKFDAWFLDLPDRMQPSGKCSVRIRNFTFVESTIFYLWERTDGIIVSRFLLGSAHGMALESKAKDVQIFCAVL